MSLFVGCTIYSIPQYQKPTETHTHPTQRSILHETLISSTLKRIRSISVIGEELLGLFKDMTLKAKTVKKKGFFCALQ